MFNDYTYVLLDWENPDDTGTQIALAALLRPNGGIDVAAALDAAHLMLSERLERNQFVFLMTDGEVRTSQIEDVRNCNMRLSKDGIEVLAFGLGGEAENIARMYPQAELFPDATALPRVFSNALVRAINRVS